MKFGLKQIALSSVMASAFVGVVAPAASAQQGDNPFLRGRYASVGERRQDGYDPLPTRAGAFEVQSSLGVSAEYNDNLFAERTGPDDDTIVRIQPDIEARSTWSTHQLNAGLSIGHDEYIANDEETVTNYNGYVGGRLDVQRSFQLTGRVNAAHVTEPRYEPAGNQVGATEPAQYDRLGFNAGAAYRNGRVQIEGSGGVVSDDFNTFYNIRDVSETFFTGRGSYAVSPDVSFFVQGRTAEQDYDNPGTLLDPNRDGKRTSVQVGTSFELQSPFRGEIAIGSIKEEKDNPALNDVDGLSADAKLEWFLTQLTTVTFRANSGVFDPGIRAAASAKNTNFGVRVDHELRRNIVLFGDAGFGKYEFDGFAANYNREDKFSDFAVGGAYKLNRHARFEIEYRLHKQDSSGVNADPTRQDVDQNIISAGFRVYP